MDQRVYSSSSGNIASNEYGLDGEQFWCVWYVKAVDLAVICHVEHIEDSVSFDMPYDGMHSIKPVCTRQCDEKLAAAEALLVRDEGNNTPPSKLESSMSFARYSLLWILANCRNATVTRARRVAGLDEESRDDAMKRQVVVITRRRMGEKAACPQLGFRAP
jgi:hypothetical protein